MPVAVLPAARIVVRNRIPIRTIRYRSRCRKAARQPAIRARGQEQMAPTSASVWLRLGSVIAVPREYLEAREVDDARLAALYDVWELWWAPFGLLLLDEVPLRPVRTVIDVGAGTGFVAVEL